MDARTQDQDQAVPGTVFTPRQVRILKVAVIVMGILLVGGFALVLGAIVYQASNIGKSAAPVIAPSIAPVVAPVSAPSGQPAQGTLSLPAGAQIRNMATGDGRIVLHVEAGGAGEIIILDIASGKVLSRVKLLSE